MKWHGKLIISQLNETKKPQRKIFFNFISNLRKNLIFRFNAEKTIQPNSEIELFPSAIPKKTGSYDLI